MTAIADRTGGSKSDEFLSASIVFTVKILVASTFPRSATPIRSASMTDTPMDVDPPAANGSASNGNAMSMLMANAKGKAKAGGQDGQELSEAELKALNEREGLPWCVCYARLLCADTVFIRSCMLKW